MLKWVTTIWRGTDPVEFASVFTVEESIARLRAVTRTNSILAQLDLDECVAGTVRADRVVLRRIIPLLHNSFRLLFIGRFESHDGKSTLRGRFIMGLFTRVFLAFWFGILSVLAILGCLAFADSPRTSWTIPLGCIALIGLGLAFARVGLWFSRNDPKVIAQAISAALQVDAAEKGSISMPSTPTSAAHRPITVWLSLVFFAFWGLSLIVSSVLGFPNDLLVVVGLILVPHKSLALREIGVVIGLAFIAVAYGVYRRSAMAWRLGIGLTTAISMTFVVLFAFHSASILAALDRSEAMQGNPVAENDLGVMYETGAGVPKSDKKAAKWYLRAAMAGDVHAQVNLAWLYQKGRGVPQSDARGLYWYRSAAEHGDAVGEFDLGQTYYYGEGIPRNFAKAAKWYRRAADQGDPSAETDLGFAYSTGRGVPKDESKAVRWFQLAAAAGDVVAQRYLAYDYQVGKGVRRDPVEAEKWIHLAALTGNDQSAMQLADLYATSTGAARHPRRALKWYRLAASGGDLDAMDAVARDYLLGDGVAISDAKAAKWYRMAAAHNDARADYGLGFIDQHGTSVPQNLPRALYWYRKGAEQGNVDSDVALGVMYEVGAGTPVNYLEARRWFLPAAVRENPTAEVNLGMMDAKAQGVPQNLVKAYAWFDVAHGLSALGSENYTVTRGAMALLRTHLRPTEIAQAEQIAQAWLATHPVKRVH